MKNKRLLVAFTLSFMAFSNAMAEETRSVWTFSDTDSAVVAVGAIKLPEVAVANGISKEQMAEAMASNQAETRTLNKMHKACADYGHTASFTNTLISINCERKAGNYFDIAYDVVKCTAEIEVTCKSEWSEKNLPRTPSIGRAWVGLKF